MLTPQQACLESTAERIARIITKEYNVSVRVEGHLAYIDLETMTIVLPNLVGDDLEQVAHVLDGFLDHECGHAIYSDKLVAQGLKGKSNLFQFWNMVEDYWTEREHGRQFIGVGENLKKLNEALAEQNYKEWDKADPVFRIMFGMHQVWRGAEAASKFESDPTIGGVFAELRDELRDGYGVSSSAEALDLAQRILDKIQSLAGAGSDHKDTPGTAKDTGQPGAPGSAGAQGKGEIQDAPGASGGAQRPDEADETKAQAEDVQSRLDAENFMAPLDAEGLFNDCLPDTPSKADHRDPEHYIVFSEEFDFDTEYSAKERDTWTGLYRELKEQVWDYLGNLSTSLELALAAEAEARWVGGSRRGRKFDKRVFPAWAMGGRNDRIYRQREQHEDWDTAVSLLWDCSGSMGSNHNAESKSSIARLAAVAFHEALTRANIAHEVLGFNTRGGDSPELIHRIRQARGRGEDTDMYSRLQELDKRMVFVPWGSPDGRAICAINGGGANRDGECVLWAAKRLVARPESRKVMIVGSDGRPSGARYGYTEEKYLQDVVSDVIKSGVEVYAIGIRDDSVLKYYPECVVINSIEDLPGAVMRQLAQALFAHKGTNHGSLSAVQRPSS